MHLITRIKTILLATSSVIVISCASSSKDIETIYVSPDQYRPLNCKSLTHELAQLNQRKNTVAAELDKKASNDQGITAVSVILFWPAAFALGGNKEQEQEYARIKGEYDAVIQVGAEKQCNLNTSPALRTASLSEGSTPVSATSPIEYYAQAEEEIHTKSYDKNLWSKALVEAEGDETKRKAKYIELRANQLYSEKPEANASNSDLPPAAMELRTYIAGNTSSGKTKKGATYHVYSSPDGTMFGKSTSKNYKESLDSGTWEITKDSQYCQKWNKWLGGKRDCYQVFALEGNKFRMKAIGGSRGSIFTIREGDPEGLVGGNAVATRFNLSGTYLSTITSNDSHRFRGDHKRLEITFEQRGNTITGTDSSGEAEINGILNGDTVTFVFYMSSESSAKIHGEWKVNAEGSQLDGSWKIPGGDTSGQWNLKKKVGAVFDTSLDQQSVPDTPGTQFDISGTYKSEITGSITNRIVKQHRNSRVTIIQVGNEIKGTLGNKGRIEGLMDGDTINFDWYLDWIEGTGEWKVENGGNLLVGKWSRKQNSSNGVWKLTRIE
jgi:hypothetical protein